MEAVSCAFPAPRPNRPSPADQGHEQASVAEALAQQVPGTFQPAMQAAGREAELLGRLLACPAFEVAKDHRQAIAFRQPH
jgi:hypothetical protein